MSRSEDNAGKEAAPPTPPLIHLTLRPLASSVPWEVRLRKVLKDVLRMHEFRCVNYRQTEREPDVNAYPTPSPGTIVAHYQNGRHEVLGVGYEHESNAPRVLYRSLADGVIRMCSLMQFHQKITYEKEIDGVKQSFTVPRFTEIAREPVPDPAAATNAALSAYREVPNQEVT